MENHSSATRSKNQKEGGREGRIGQQLAFPVFDVVPVFIRLLSSISGRGGWELGNNAKHFAALLIRPRKNRNTRLIVGDPTQMKIQL